MDFTFSPIPWVSTESGGSPSEGHNPPRGSPRKFASQRALRGSLRGLCGVSPRVLRGLCGVLRGSAGFSQGFSRFFRGSEPMLVTLRNCWIGFLQSRTFSRASAALKTSGGSLNSPWNYSSHETTTLECSTSTSWGPKAVTAVKWRLLHSAIIERQQFCTHNSRQTTKSPSQQPWNDESETQQGAWDFASFHGCCRFKCLLGFSEHLSSKIKQRSRAAPVRLNDGFFPQKKNDQEIKLSGLQKGSAERGRVKKRHKSSKGVKNIFNTFRHFSHRAKKTSKIVKRRQNMFRHFSAVFARHEFSGPFWGALKNKYCKTTGNRGWAEEKGPWWSERTNLGGHFGYFFLLGESEAPAGSVFYWSSHGDSIHCSEKTAVENAQKLGKLDLFMDTPFLNTPLGPAWNFSARNSGAGNGCADFMGAFFGFFLLEKGLLGFLERGGVEVPILFLWAWGFVRIAVGPIDFNRERPKRDDDNWEHHLVDHQMLHLKPLFHFTIQTRDNTWGEFRCYIRFVVLSCWCCPSAGADSIICQFPFGRESFQRVT